MTATADDYSWLNDDRWWADAYCLTIVRDIGSTELMSVLAADPLGESADREELDRRTYEIGTVSTLLPSGASLIGSSGRELVGMRELQAGTLMLEINGFLGVTRERMAPVGARHDAVSLFRNVNADDRFHWWGDGELQLDFEIWDPYFDGMSEDMQRAVRAAGVGSASEDDPYRDTLASWALAENLTGIRLTADHLTGPFDLATVSGP